MQVADTLSAAMPSAWSANDGIWQDMSQEVLFVGNVDLSGVVPHQPQGVQGQHRTERVGDNDVVVGLFLLMFCIMAYVIGNSKYFFAHRIREFFSRRRAYTGGDAEVLRSEVRNTVLLTTVSCLSLAIMFCNRLAINGADGIYYEAGNLFPTLGVSFAVIVLLLAMKTAVYAFVNGVFFSRDANAKWLSSFFLLCSAVSLFLFPVSLVEVYSEVDKSVVTYCLLGVLVLCKICIFYRLYVNFCSKKEGFLLIFLYFCNVEVLPLLLVWRFCSNLL